MKLGLGENQNEVRARYLHHFVRPPRIRTGWPCALSKKPGCSAAVFTLSRSSLNMILLDCMRPPLPCDFSAGDRPPPILKEERLTRPPIHALVLTQTAAKMAKIIMDCIVRRKTLYRRPRLNKIIGNSSIEGWLVIRTCWDGKILHCRWQLC